MLSAGDFRNGSTFEMDGNVVTIVEFQHVKPGKGAAFVRAKIKNVMTGAVTERTFNPSDKYQEAFIEKNKGFLSFFLKYSSTSIPLYSYVRFNNITPRK